MRRGTRVRRRSNGATGRVAGDEQADGRVYVQLDGGSACLLPLADLEPVDEPTAGDAPAREIGKMLAGGDIETK